MIKSGFYFAFSFDFMLKIPHIRVYIQSLIIIEMNFKFNICLLYEFELQVNDNSLILSLFHFKINHLFFNPFKKSITFFNTKTIIAIIV